MSSGIPVPLSLNRKLHPLFILATGYIEFAAAGHRINGIDDQVHEDFSKLGCASVSTNLHRRIEIDFVFQASQPGFVFPTCSRDLDCVNE